MRPNRVRQFASNSVEYHTAFSTFLKHTDQKEKALDWLTQEIGKLPRKNAMIDAGAGNGKLTSWFATRFARIVAIEPNDSLVKELREACPTVAVLPTTITAAQPSEAADFILCSHVFYYVARPQWETHLGKLIQWLAPGGVLAIALQNAKTDCMHLLQHFIGKRFDLGELSQAAQRLTSEPLDVRIETVPAYVHTADLDTACAIAEFMLNLLPMSVPHDWSALEEYVSGHFHQSDGSYRFSCHQDFLRVQRRD